LPGSGELPLTPLCDADFSNNPDANRAGTRAAQSLSGGHDRDLQMLDDSRARSARSAAVSVLGTFAPRQSVRFQSLPQRPLVAP